MEHLWKVLQSTAEWTRFLDTKAQVLLAGAGVLGGFELKLVSKTALAGTSVIHQITAWSSVILVALTVLAAIVALTPRTKRKATTTESHIFYGAIAKRYPQDCGGYEQAVLATVADEPALKQQLANQIWEVSLVAAVKSTAVAWGARFLVASLLLAGAAAAVPGLRG